MPRILPAVLALGAVALPSTAFGQVAATPPTPVAPTTATGSGYALETFWSGPSPNPAEANLQASVQPGVVASAFGQVWVPDSRDGGVISVLDPASGALLASHVIPGLPPASAALMGGSWLWVAGHVGQRTVVMSLNSAGATGPTFRAPTPSPNGGTALGDLYYGGIGLATGAGSLWVADQAAGRVYAISPSTGKLVRTIRVAAPRSVAVQGGRVWVTSTSSSSLRIFSASTGAAVRTVPMGGDSYVMAPAAGSMWVFTDAGISGVGLRTLTRTKKPVATIETSSGWAGAVATSAGVWASNYGTQAVLFDPATRRVLVNVSWNNDIAGGLAAVGTSAWVADGSLSSFPLGSGVTRITPTP